MYAYYTVSQKYALWCWYCRWCMHGEFSYESVSEIILKIGPNLRKLLSNIKGLTFLRHSVVYDTVVKQSSRTALMKLQLKFCWTEVCCSTECTGLCDLPYMSSVFEGILHIILRHWQSTASSLSQPSPSYCATSSSNFWPSGLRCCWSGGVELFTWRFT